jgi:hypothetical protein
VTMHVPDTAPAAVRPVARHAQVVPSFVLSVVRRPLASTFGEVGPMELLRWERPRNLNAAARRELRHVIITRTRSRAERLWSQPASGQSRSMPLPCPPTRDLTSSSSTLPRLRCATSSTRYPHASGSGSWAGASSCGVPTGNPSARLGSASRARWQAQLAPSCDRGWQSIPHRGIDRRLAGERMRHNGSSRTIERSGQVSRESSELNGKTSK